MILILINSEWGFSKLWNKSYRHLTHSHPEGYSNRCCYESDAQLVRVENKEVILKS